MAANRKVTVQVNLQGTGNLSQTAQQAAAQVAKLQSTVKGVPAGVPVAQFAPGAAQATAPAQIPQAGLLATKLAAASQQKVMAAETQLAYLRTGPGQRATIAATRAEADLAKQQQYLAQIAARGKFGAAFDSFANPLQSRLQAAGNVGAVGMASAYAGIASVSPEASSQITNSFRMIANEIGIAAIPAATQLTATLQEVSRGIRTANEATDGMAGTTLVYSAVALAAAGALSRGISFIRTTASGLGAGAVLSNPATWWGAAGAFAGYAVGAPIAAASERAMHARGEAARAEGRDTSGDFVNRRFLGIPLLPTWFRTDQTPPAFRPGPGSTDEFSVVPANHPSRRLGGLQDVSDRNPRMYASSDDLESALNMRAGAVAGPLAEQQTRAMETWLEAMRTNNDLLRNQNAIGAAMVNFIPQAGENG